MVPVYRSTATLPDLVRRVGAALGATPHEIVLVDDGSSDETWGVVRGLASPAVRGLRLGRNAGQHAALVAGTRAARHDRIVTIDDDLQNPPEEIPRLLERLAAGDADVVYGVPAVPAQDPWRRLAARWSRRARRASAHSGPSARRSARPSTSRSGPTSRSTRSSRGALIGSPRCGSSTTSARWDGPTTRCASSCGS